MWPERPWRQASGEERRCDALWVECRLDEVDAKVIACTPTSRREALMREVAELVAFARDASQIEAHPWHFPSGNLWNGDSPFQEIAERSIDGLHELSG